MSHTTNEPAVITPTARVTAARLAIREARPRRLTSLLLWAAQIPLAALYVIEGWTKLDGNPMWVQGFGDIGAGQWLRYFTGIVELSGAIGLLTPWLAGLAAAGLAATMVGAIILVPGSVMITLPLCAVLALLAYGRRRQIKALWAAIRR